MRVVFLSIIILSAIYLVLPVKHEGEQIDDVKVRLSAIQRERPTHRPLALIRKAEILPEIVNESPEDSVETDIAASEEDSAQIEHVDESVENAHEKGWQDELSQALVTLEPEQGEEMFNSYVNERNSFQASLDDTIRSNQKSQDLEFIISEMETKHEEKVKEIFGSHYEDVKDLEAKYLESESH